MKKNVLALCLAMAVLAPISASAQEEVNLVTTRENQLSRGYLRASISNIFLTDGSSIANEIINNLEQISTDKFDVNQLQKNVFSIGVVEKEEDLRIAVDAILRENKVANQIMMNWFPEFINEQEGYSFRVLEERGRYAATDSDILKSNASHRKSLLNNLGESLIDRSYVKVYYVSSKAEDGVKVNCLVYKLNFNEEVRTTFYDKHFNTPKGIIQAHFPLVPVAEVSDTSGILKGESKYSSVLNILKKSQGIEGDGAPNYPRTAVSLYEDIDVKIGKKLADFKVQTAVIATSPIKAKIGKKEGLKIDDKFDVMEFVLNNEGKEVAKRKAVVRVDDHIADNRKEATGETTDMTQFYKFLGGRVEEGMTLVEHPEYGVSITPYASLSGVGLMVDYRTKLYPGFFGYIKGDLPIGKDVEGKKGLIKAYSELYIDGKGNILVDEKDSHTIFRLGIGLMKEFYFARNLVAGIGLGGGKVFATKSENNQKLNFNVWYAEGIGRLGLQLAPSFQIFAQVDYNHYFGSGQQFIYGGKTFELYNGKDFNEDTNKFGIGVGTKISF